MSSCVCVLAPLRQELAPLLARLPRARRLRIGAGRGWESTYRGRPLLLCVTGDGRRRAETTLRALLGEHRVERVLALGIAGGASAELLPGDFLVGGEVQAVEERGGEFSLSGTPWRRTWDPLPAALRAQPEGTLLTVPRIVAAAADKARLRRLVPGNVPVAVDLESASMARECADRAVPLLVVRAVSDAAGEDLPSVFSRSLRADGSTAKGRLALELLRAPHQVPAVVDLARRVRRCARRLAAAAEAILREE